MRRNLVVATVLAVLIAVVQVGSGSPLWIVLLSAAIAFVLTLGILWVADRLGRTD